MKRYLSKIAPFFTLSRSRTWPSWWLAVLGVAAFCISGYIGLFLADFVIGLVKATDEAGVTVEAVLFWIVAGAFALPFWFFGCIAARCHLTLFSRHF